MAVCAKSAILFMVFLALAFLACAEDGISPDQIRSDGDTLYAPWQSTGEDKAAPRGKRSGGHHRVPSFNPNPFSVDAKDGQSVEVNYVSGEDGSEGAFVGVH
ncbi:hypothetical protein AAVH_18145 [Aphelenchoides avenae]|nr:hypothetical protein AAVH_18145 [Aphelenchus avenae]